MFDHKIVRIKIIFEKKKKRKLTKVTIIVFCTFHEYSTNVLNTVEYVLCLIAFTGVVHTVYIKKSVP